MYEPGPLVPLRIFTLEVGAHDFMVPLEVRTADFRDWLIATLGLAGAEEENPLVLWRMELESRGRILGPDATLGANGVRDGDRLCLLRQIAC
jgi:hypothetical protein